jgi:hypothetical protein
MEKQVYYCILKKYKGLFKKKFVGVTHLFILPRTDYDYLYLALLGERLEVSGTYACLYITRIPDNILDSVVGGEKEYFGSRFEVVEQKLAEVKVLVKGSYLIKLKEDSDVFPKKDILLTYQAEESTPKKRIYNLTTKLDLKTKEVGSDTIGGVALRNSILLGTSRFIGTRYNQINKINK